MTIQQARLACPESRTIGSDHDACQLDRTLIPTRLQIELQIDRVVHLLSQGVHQATLPNTIRPALVWSTLVTVIWIV